MPMMPELEGQERDLIQRQRTLVFQRLVVIECVYEGRCDPLRRACECAVVDDESRSFKEAVAWSGALVRLLTQHRSRFRMDVLIRSRRGVNWGRTEVL
jgi:hypothetical protein